MKLSFDNMVIHVWEGVYQPSDDTFMLLDNLKLNCGELVLDVGTGSGILAINYALSGCYVVGIDVSKVAVRNAQYNAKINKVEERTAFLCSDVTSALRDNCEFDAIIMNPPYLPSTGDPRIDEPSWSGGIDGTSMILRVIKDVYRVLSKNGRLYFVTSSFTENDKILSTLKSTNLQYSILAKKRFWLEELFLVEVRACPTSG
ncbi:MAG: methyltransferase [Candidatus Nezhaarchaeales archaeon]